MLNRKQRRNIEKKLKQAGKSPEAIEKYIAFKTATSNRKNFVEGERVRLDIGAIKSHPDWNRKTPEYKQFVNSNVGTVFTVEYDENHKEDRVLLCLKEDPTPAKWLFWEGELSRVDKIEKIAQKEDKGSEKI